MNEREAAPGLQELSPGEYAAILAATERSRALAEALDAPDRTRGRAAFLREALVDLEASAADDPAAWVYRFKLCDLYLEAKQYAAAVRAGERALALRPRDPRSVYALATAYRALTQARYTDRLAQARPGFDPPAARRALDSLGLTADQAGCRAQQLFSRLLQLSLSPAERELVRDLGLEPLARELRAPNGRPARPGRPRWWPLLAVAGLAASLVLGRAAVVRGPEPPAVEAAAPPVGAVPTAILTAAPAPTPTAGLAGPPPATAAACVYGPRFQALVQRLGTGLVGDCLTDETAGAADGAVQQLTSRGLLAWRPDGTTAFGDGARSWYLCPSGVEQRPSAEPFRCGAGAVLLADDFDDPAAGHLPPASDDPRHYASGYVDGEYAIRTLDPAWPIAPVEYLPDRYADATLAVDVRLVGPADRRYVALICRDQGPDGSHYRLTVAPAEGWALLTRWDQGQPVHLTREQPSDAIRRDGEVNHVELTCADSTIAASVNGRPVALVQDATYRDGRLGLSASSFVGASATAEARFDNLAVRQP